MFKAKSLIFPALFRAQAWVKDNLSGEWGGEEDARSGACYVCKSKGQQKLSNQEEQYFNAIFL